ncbi:6700_t:CDS:1, partial [Racocetra fulgida]
DEYRRLYVAANGEVLGLKQEIRLDEERKKLTRPAPKAALKSLQKRL